MSRKRKETLSEKRSRASLSRKTFGGGGARIGSGRPRATVRCPCGLNSLKRAQDRAFDCCKKAGMVPRA